MSRKFEHPAVKGVFVELPDEWLGKHISIREEAADSARNAGLKGEIAEFAVSLALAENFDLPGLSGKPEKWDFSELPLNVIAWVVTLVTADFNNCYSIPKAWALSSINGQKTMNRMIARNTTTENQKSSETE